MLIYNHKIYDEIYFFKHTRQAYVLLKKCRYCNNCEKPAIKTNYFCRILILISRFGQDCRRLSLT